MKRFLYSFLLINSIVFSSCKEEKKSIVAVKTEKIIPVETQDTIPVSTIQKSRPKLSYPKTKQKIRKVKDSLSTLYQSKKISLDSTGIVFKKYMVNHLIPYWYGTFWSFEGHTATPQQGQIACGYFVSTTLKHMGLQLNRYKLAQRSPYNEAKLLSCNTTIHKVKAKNTKDAITQFKAITKEGLYFIGFDENHVGYLLNTNDNLYLIHSNYLEPVAVCVESVFESEVLSSFDTFYVLPISANNELMLKWLTGENVF